MATNKFKLQRLLGKKGQEMATEAPNSYSASTSLEDNPHNTATVRPPRQLPLIGNFKIGEQARILLTTGVIFLLFAAALLFFSTRQTTLVSASAEMATELQMLSQRISRGASLTVLGDPAGFKQIKESRNRFHKILTGLLETGAVESRDVAVVQGEKISPILDEIKQKWDKAAANAALILNNEDSLSALATGIEQINRDNAPLLEIAEQAAAELAQGSGNVREVAFANQLVMLTQRIVKNANALVGTDDIDPEVAFLLGKDVGSFRDILNGLLKGSEALRLSSVRDVNARNSFLELQKRFQASETPVNTILQNMQKLISAKQAAYNINQFAEPLLDNATKLTAAYIASNKVSQLLTYLGALLGFLGVGAISLIIKTYVDEARYRRAESDQENRKNQEAILRLLNEMGSLADGDLTVQASVTEDVTGAIADSINYTIEELKALVTGINRVTGQINAATQSSLAISDRLFNASQKQSRAIQETGGSILNIAASINEVSHSAAQSAQVAQLSLNAAERGQHAVQDAIAGMNEIRDQIQETSKRIKRLGESSLEIGEIIELISDITEQTNVLALNAAIQAASAGEAGRGFTVVAEEVQRLAERSAEATKQIEAIVKTIQADTQNAVGAMEKSTQGVVEGAKLSDAAGQTLEEIRRVSHELAELIGGISGQTQRQSKSVTEVTQTMQDILGITEETTEGTKQTNVSITRLNQLADELKASVAGFKL